MPSSIWRLTFSTTIMASSTTRPMANTSASKVRRLIEKLSASIKISAPIRDNGMAMIGIMTDRGEPRKTKTTKATISTASISVL